MSAPLRILLIEQMPYASQLAEAIQNAGEEAELNCTNTLETAQEQLNQPADWDLLIANPDLLGGDPADCLKRLNDKNSATPIILVAEDVTAEKLSAWYAAGAQAVVESNNLSLLNPTLQHVLRQAAGRREQLSLNQSLYKSRNRYLNLLKHAPAASLIINNDKIALINEKAREILGLSARSSQEQINRLTNPFLRLISGLTENQPVQTIVRHLDGTPIRVEILASELRTSRNTVTQLFFKQLDAEKQAAENIPVVTRCFDPSHEGLMEMDTNIRITAVNQTLCKITGYSEQELIGRSPDFLKSHRNDEAFLQELMNLLQRKHRWHGEIWYRRKDGEANACWLNIAPLLDQQGEIDRYLAVFSEASQAEQPQTGKAQLEHLAYHDPLTDLPNRLLFEDRLEHAIKQARRQCSHLAVFFLDLDRFKNINDSLGHIVGDTLLKQASRRLVGMLRDNDTPARSGGDEFTILVENLEDPNHAALIASKILEQFQRPFRIFDRDLHVTASIGISIYPDDGEDVGNLTKNADAAMYKAKESGRNNYRFYTAELTKSAYDRLLLESELRTAIKHQQLLLYYQPQFSLASGRITGAEALLRWRHPRMGVIPPSRFIPLAEETGLIHELGHWVLEQACAQTYRWSKSGLFSGRMAINLSVRQIMQTDLILKFEEIIDNTGCPPTQLQFEVTEGIFMGQKELSIPVLEVFKKLGVTIAIDDFGTGYSSLSYLKQLPIDKLKIDRSFIKDMSMNPDDAAIIQTIIALGQNLGIEIIAEGVETHAQEELLKLMGCQEVQGYLYGIPVPPSLFEENLINGNHRNQVAPRAGA
jgi:diguanylate cyclase (GGDEF)-like protein/PAS domain S-box-containing protein